MKQVFILWLFIVIMSTARGQCKSGNCINGNGKMDFGWCVYEGAFINGKTEGVGTMKYNDYTYAGNFKNGVENGDGIITYTDGRKENVHYVNGQKMEAPIKFAVNEYKPLNPQDPNCISGDCINGYGTYVWSSGNKYTGNWKNSKREGQGSANFANGEKFSGTWHNNEQSEGNYIFSSGATYTGTYTSDGKELNGQISLGDKIIPYVNGVAKIPPPPVIVYHKTEPVKKMKDVINYSEHTCPRCNGSGRDNVTDRYGNTTSQTCGLCNGARTIHW